MLSAIDGEMVGGTGGVSCDLDGCDKAIGEDERILAYIIRDAAKDIRPMNFFCPDHEEEVEIRDLTTMGTAGALVEVGLTSDITGGLEIDAEDGEIRESLGEVSDE